MFGLDTNQILFIVGALGVNLLSGIFFILFLCLDPARHPGTLERWLIGKTRQLRNDYLFLPTMYPSPRDLEKGQPGRRTEERPSEQPNKAGEQRSQAKDEKTEASHGQESTEATAHNSKPELKREMTYEELIAGSTRTPVHPLFYSNPLYIEPQFGDWNTRPAVLGYELPQRGGRRRGRGG